MSVDLKKSIQSLREALRANLEDLDNIGMLMIPRMSAPRPKKNAQVEAAVVKSEMVEQPLNILEPHESLDSKEGFTQLLESSLEQSAKLEQLRAEYLGKCDRCKLARGRSQIVFGAGNPEADLMFIGEAPSLEDDKRGVPFVGASGQLLDRMIKAMGYDRQNVYLTSVVKCRPPQNRNPEKDEVASCRPFLQAQIDIVNPKVIVCLGKFASQTLLESKMPISKLRGEWQELHGRHLMPTFHPAYLLRAPEHKRLVWTDLQKVMHFLK